MWKRVLVSLWAVVMLLGSVTASRAAQIVLTFEDLSDVDVMPDPYLGIIDWEDGVWWHYDFDDPDYLPHSGATRTFQDQTDTTPSWEFLHPVVFDGAWWSGVDFATVQYELYDAGNNLVHTSAVLNGTAVAQFLASGYGGLVTRVVALTPSADFIVMDDLTYTDDLTVSEPGLLGLVGVGLTLAARRTRRGIARR